MKNNEELLEQQGKVNPVEIYVNELKEGNAKNSDKEIKIDEKPEFLLPQFKNIEEQAKSYKELQALQTRQAQELAKYKKKEEMNNTKENFSSMLGAIEEKNFVEQKKLNDIYQNELMNIKLALKSGKITENEADIFTKQLKSFISDKLMSLNSQYKIACDKCGNDLNMLSPKEYFKEELVTKNYLAPISDFLENNYKKMTKSELDNVKNLIANLENSLREEILLEVSLKNENENYRNALNSATNLNPQKTMEKIYSLAEIKKMKPDEFRKNQKAILEQFTARKIK